MKEIHHQSAQTFVLLWNSSKGRLSVNCSMISSPSSFQFEPSVSVLWSRQQKWLTWKSRFCWASCTWTTNPVDRNNIAGMYISSMHKNNHHNQPHHHHHHHHHQQQQQQQINASLNLGADPFAEESQCLVQAAHLEGRNTWPGRPWNREKKNGSQKGHRFTHHFWPVIIGIIGTKIVAFIYNSRSMIWGMGWVHSDGCLQVMPSENRLIHGPIVCNKTIFYHFIIVSQVEMWPVGWCSKICIATCLNCFYQMLGTFTSLKKGPQSPTTVRRDFKSYGGTLVLNCRIIWKTSSTWGLAKGKGKAANTNQICSYCSSLFVYHPSSCQHGPSFRKHHKPLRPWQISRG